MTLATFDYDNRGKRTKLTRGIGTVTDYTLSLGVISD
jgi:hypothetical protein